jgi:hypothetical protein
MSTPPQVKRKFKVLSAQEKLNLIDKVKKGVPKNVVASECGFGYSTV